MADVALADALKAVMRSFVRSVVVISARRGDALFAITATAVAEVSLSPPSMLFCVNRMTRIFEAIEAGEDVALNVLRADQATISHVCGGAVPNSERFAGDDWECDGAGPPLLREALAVVVLRPANFVDHGSHRVVVGNVIDVRASGVGSALTYGEGVYLTGK